MGKTITHSLLRGQLSRLLLLVTLAVFGVVGAKAVDKSDMTKIELGVTYTVPAMTSNAYYYYEATETGKLTFTGTKCPRLYTDDTFATEGKNNANTVFTTNTVDVEAGTTYYFKASWEFDKKTFTASFKGSAAGAIGLLSVSPEAGSTLDVTSESKSNIYVTFDTDIDKGSLSISIVAGGKTVSVDENPNVSSAKKIVIPTKETVYGLLADGTIKEGDDVKVEITGICDADNDENLYNGDGKLSLTYKAPKAPIGINSEASAIPTAFKSYWAKGNEAGVMKLVFTGNVGEVASATLMFGNKDNDASGGYYEETLPMAIEGNTVTVDFTGVKRTQATMLPNYTAETYTNIAVKVAGVKDTDGNYAYSTSQGSVGSFSFNWTLEEVANDLSYEFIPSDGDIIDSLKSIELWLSKDNVDYKGVEFNYINRSNKQKTEYYTKAQIPVQQDEEGGLVLTIPTPSDVQQARALNVEVTLDSITDKDGNGLEPITINYNKMDVAIVDFKYAEAADVDTIHGTDSIFVQLTPALASHIDVVYYYVTNITTGEKVKTGYIRPYAKNGPVGVDKGNGLWANDFGVDYALYADNQYAISAAAYCQDGGLSKKVPFASDSIFVYGASKTYKYSDYKLVSLTPDPATVTLEKASDAVFTVEFDGPVAVNDDNYTFINTGSGTSASFEYIKPMDGDENAKYAKKWEFSAEKWVKANGNGAPLQISIAAEDEQGRRVKGNSGLETTSFFDYTYECSVGTPRLTFTPDSGSTVESLDSVIVNCSIGISESYYVSQSKIVVTDAEGNEVAHAASVAPVIPEAQKNNADYFAKQAVVKFDKSIVAPGTYKVTVPAKYFLICYNQMNTVNSVAAEATYTIAAPEGVAYNLMPTAITPDTAKVQEYLGIIQVKFGEEIYALPDEMATDSITFVNKQTREVIKGEAYVSGTTLYVMPSAEINASEEAYSYWTLSIPQGFVFNEAGTEANFQGGNANPALVYNYTVGIEKAEKTNVTADPADGSTVESLSRVILTFVDEPAVNPSYDNDLSITVTDAMGNVVCGAVSDVDWNIEEFNKIPVDLKQTITEAGTYTIHIPAGFYILGEYGDTSSSEITLTYTVGTATGINGLDATKDGKTVIFTLDGKKAAKATKGLYIIGGKKVVVK